MFGRRRVKKEQAALARRELEQQRADAYKAQSQLETLQLERDELKGAAHALEAELEDARARAREAKTTEQQLRDEFTAVQGDAANAGGDHRPEASTVARSNQI